MALSVAHMHRLDAKLARVCRSAGALRLGIGAALEVLSKGNGHRELGFSSLEAYALERCGRSTRWAQESRKLALTLENLPRIREALRSGRIGWSMAALIARHVSVEDEALWEEEAGRRTFREMKRLVLGPRVPFAEELAGTELREAPGGPSGIDGQEQVESAASAGDTHDEVRVLSIAADREEVWLYECARILIGHIAGHHVSADDVVSALVAEGTTTILPFLPTDVISEHELALARHEAEQRAWEAQLAQWRDHAEALCEPHIKTWVAEVAGAASGTVDAGHPNTGGADAACADKWLLDVSPEELDAHIRNLGAELVERDVAIGRLAEAFWAVEGWRRLHYATGKQYAREQLGMSLSSIKEKRLLARRLGRMPTLRGALQAQALGYESARVVARVATRQTEAAWVERARERTVRHLREEADIAEMLARRSEGSRLVPPSDALVREIHAIEGRIMSGAAFLPHSETAPIGVEPRQAPPPATHVPLDPSQAPPPAIREPVGPSQTSARASATWTQAAEARASATWTQPAEARASATWTQAAEAKLDDIARRLSALLNPVEGDDTEPHPTRSPGRVTIRLRVREDTYRAYRSLERHYRRFAPSGRSFLAFVCLNLIDSWKAALGRDVAYAAIYARDRYRCSSPVCGRRDVTPHHLRFRSAGGDDSAENLVSLCAACHLEGIHRGRIKASPPASSIHWSFGKRPHTRVQGRRKIGDRD